MIDVSSAHDVCTIPYLCMRVIIEVRGIGMYRYHAGLKLTFSRARALVSSLKGGRLNKNVTRRHVFLYFWKVVYDLAILSEILFLAKRTVLKYYYFRTVLLHSVTHLSQKICQLYIRFYRPSTAHPRFR